MRVAPSLLWSRLLWGLALVCGLGTSSWAHPGLLAQTRRPEPANANAARMGNIAAGWNERACRKGWRFRTRSNARRRTGDDRARRRATGAGDLVHHAVRGEQDLSRHRARARNVRHTGSSEPGEAPGDDQPRGALHAAGAGVCPAAVCRRHRGSVRGGCGRPRSRPVYRAR